MPVVTEKSGHRPIALQLMRCCLDGPFWLMGLVACLALSLRSTVEWPHALWFSLGHAALYRLLYWLIATRQNLWQLAWGWLGIPLLLFAATWLRQVWALLLTPCWLAALWYSAQCGTAATSPSGDLGGYLLLLGWVSFCGAGGYGFQSSDYVMHNGRLLDLIQYSWPVYYPQASGELLLVQYAGYYLVPALIGKLAGTAAAMLAQHLWLLAGCWLVLRMTLALLGTRHAWPLAVGLILFGGWDVIGVLLVVLPKLAAQPEFVHMSLTTMASELLSSGMRGVLESGWLDSWPAMEVAPDVWFGNFVSLAFSLLWAPHQSVAAWLTVCLLLLACKERCVSATLFAGALLAYWSPMVVMGLSPVVLVLAMWQLANRKPTARDIWCGLAGFSVLVVLVLYYFSASAGTQPYGSLFSSRTDWRVFVVFLLASWLPYALLAAWHRKLLSSELRVFAGALFLSCALLSMIHYGVYNDLLARSSAVVMFGILLLMASIAQSLRAAQQWHRLILFGCLLLPGLLAGTFNLLHAVRHAHVRVPGQSVAVYGAGWQFLGHADSLFVRYLANRPAQQE